MTRRHVHYEQAFEHYLRANRVPYIAVDEARKTLLPVDAELDALKSFDFLVNAPHRQLLIDVKGRRYAGGRRFESWVTRDDVESLAAWEHLFGEGFESVFVFIYSLDEQPPDALFEAIFAFRDHWYALREVSMTAYRTHMKPRSERWSTVDVPAADFSRISRPLDLRR
jgi:hypothetical protein